MSFSRKQQHDDLAWSSDDELSSSSVRRARGRNPHADASDSDVSLPADYGDGLPTSFSGGGSARRRRVKRPRSPALLDPRVDGDEAAAVHMPAGAASGTWEQHTKGIGSRLLAKMGFTGRLGKKEDGISVPVTARVRPEKLGLGAGAFAERSGEEDVAEQLRVRNKMTGLKSDGSLGTEVGKGSSGREKSSVKRWKKQGVGRDATEARVLVTRGARLEVVELERISKEKAEQTACIGFSAVKEKKLGPGMLTLETLALEEALFNLQVLVDTARQDCSTASEKVATERALQENAQITKSRLVKELELARVSEQRVGALLNDLQAFLSLVPNLDSADGMAEGGDRENSTRELSCATRAVDELNRLDSIRWALGSDMFADCRVRDAIVAVLEPWARSLAANAILRASRVSREVAPYGRDLSDIPSDTITTTLLCVFETLRSVVGGGETEAYTRLVCRTLIVPLQRCIAYKWDPSAVAEMADFIRLLKHHIAPAALIQLISADVLVPRLVRAVDAWRVPRVGSIRASSGLAFGQVVRLDRIVMPWLPVLGRRALAPVLSAVRHRLGALLRVWSAVDEGLEESELLLELVRPWKGVLSRSKFEGLLSRYVVKRLGQEIQTHVERLNVADALVRGDRSEVVSAAFKDPPAVVLKSLMWYGVVEDQVLSAALQAGLFAPVALALQHYLFGSKDGDASRAVALYNSLKSWFASCKYGPGFVEVQLAALLFVIHAHTVTGEDTELRAGLARADVSILFQSGYGRGAGSGRELRKSVRRRSGHEEETGERASFKDAVQRVAVEHGVRFVGTGRTLGNGWPEYEFGKVRVHLDGTRQIVFVHATANGDTGGNQKAGFGAVDGTEGEFRAVGLSELVALAGRST